MALDVSEATVRRDLTMMAEEGLVSRARGGAILPASSTAFEPLYPEKRLINTEEKRRIGVEAALMVVDGETLILDSGSTTFEIARNLTDHKNLTIITNDLVIASSVMFDSTTSVIVTGGIRRQGFNTLIGPVTDEFLQQVKVNKTFLAADAIDFQQGVTNATFAEISVKRLMIQAAREVILVADHSKFANIALARVCPLDKVHCVITDSSIDESILQDFQRLDIPIKIV